MKLRLFPLLATLALAACAPRLIPGTDIVDNQESRAILDVMQQYRAALEGRNANKILELASEQYKDNSGTADPADDLDYATLRRVLPQRMEKLEDVSVDMNVRKITVDRDVANVIYYFNIRYRMPKYTGKPQSEGDLQQMWLKKVGGQWKIVSGL